MAISKRTRFEVFHRDGFTCRYCGKHPPGTVLEVDHVVAVANGGGDEIANLVTACFDCNRGKSATALTEVPESVDDQVVRRREALEQLQAYKALVEEERASRMNVVEELGVYWFDQFSEEPGRFTFGSERSKSVMRFVKELRIDQIYEAIDIAMARRPPTRSTGYDANTFKYFCGICWTKIRESKDGIDRP